MKNWISKWRYTQKHSCKQRDNVYGYSEKMKDKKEVTPHMEVVKETTIDLIRTRV